MIDDARQRRITEGARTAVSQPAGTASPAVPPSSRYIGIVRDVITRPGQPPTVIDVIRWQRVRYRDKTPVFGQYEAYGDVEDGYPLEFTKATDYTSLKVTGEPTSSSTPIVAVKRRGVWIIERFGGSGAVFPVSLVQSGGSNGTGSSPPTLRYIVQDPTTGVNLIPTAVDPAATPHKFRRPFVGFVHAATFGLAYRNAQSQIVLMWINEIPYQEPCT